MPVVHVTALNEMSAVDRAGKAATMIAGDRSLRETAGRPDRNSLILHRWMTLHFPEEMMEDVRPVDANRTHKYSNTRRNP